MKTVPVITVEEHFEAFLAWSFAVRSGWIERTGNVLFHVDEHGDLETPHLETPVPGFDAGPGVVSSFTYDQLHIGSFIIPSFYRGLFQRFLWLRQEHRPRRAPCDIYVYSESGDGRRLKTARKPSEGEGSSSCQGPIRMSWVSEEEGPEAVGSLGESVVLDIDLDYFSCSSGVGEGLSIEITREAYEELSTTPYHPVRLLHPKLKVEDRNGRFFLRPQRPVTGPPLKVSDDEVRERLHRFDGYLERLNLQPRLIGICRSRYSGFTPPDQWSLIEEGVLAIVGRYYPLEMHRIQDLVEAVPARSAG